NFTSTGSTLSASGSVALGAAANYDLNLGHANTWTADQTFNGAATGLVVGNDATIGGTLGVTGVSNTNGISNTGTVSSSGNITTSAGNLVATAGNLLVNAGGVQYRYRTKGGAATPTLQNNDYIVKVNGA